MHRLAQPRRRARRLEARGRGNDDATKKTGFDGRGPGTKLCRRNVAEDAGTRRKRRLHGKGEGKCGGEVDDKEVTVPSDVPVMTTPYTTITEKATESTAISGGALDDTSTHVEHDVVDYQHNTDVVTNYGHGETIGRILC